MHINCVCGEDGGVGNVMPNAKPDDTTRRMQNIATFGLSRKLADKEYGSFKVLGLVGYSPSTRIHRAFDRKPCSLTATNLLLGH